ncbi:MAG TPA: hypothetical protein VHU82_16600 [Vicinamibacterales bacterium]|jgi:hypothetical protein|nr:hypothetical protein [Vicinamibacterales bacterium]
MRPLRSRVPFTIGLFVLAASIVSSQALLVTTNGDLPPGDLADPIEALMMPGGQRVSVADTTIEFWWVKTLPLTSETHDVSWGSVDEGTLVGSVMLSAPYPDARGRMVPAGLYTLRYGSQPQTADRSGVSRSRDFLLLSPAGADDKTSPLDHDDVVALARQTPGAAYPLEWSIDPPAAAGTSGSTRPVDGGQTAMIVALPASRDGRDAGTLTFRLVLAGTIQPR